MEVMWYCIMLFHPQKGENSMMDSGHALDQAELKEKMVHANKKGREKESGEKLFSAGLFFEPFLHI